MDRRSTVSSVSTLAHYYLFSSRSIVSSLGLRDASDLETFQSARKAGATIMSKDQDSVDLVKVHGVPPQIIGHMWKHFQYLPLHPSPTNVPNPLDAPEIR